MAAHAKLVVERRAATAAAGPRAAWRGDVAGGLVYLLALLAGAVGLAWDIQWHVWVGRDTFWSPPHLLLYAGVATFGALCLGYVGARTYARRRPRASGGYARASEGYALGAAGAVVLLAAAPFDDLWHRLYGIDVDLWTPAHLVGLAGGVLAGVGLVAVWAALRRAHAPGSPWSWYTWLGLFALSGLLSHLLTIAQPALNRYPTFDLGPLRALSLPILQAAALAGTLVVARQVVGRPGGALALVGLLWARQAAIGLLVPALIQAAVAGQGLSYRWPGGLPPAGLSAVLSPLLFVPAALGVEAALWLAGSRGAVRGPLLAGLLVALAQVALAPLLIGGASQALAPIAVLAPEVVGRPGAGLEAAASTRAAALPLAALAGLGSALLGARLGAALARQGEPGSAPAA